MKISLRSFANVVLVATLALSATACFKHSYTVGTGGNTSHDPQYAKWHSHFLYGIIGEKDVAVREVCPSGNGTVKDEISFVNGLVGALVGIVYYPTTVEVYCAEGGKAAMLTLSPATMRAIASDPKTSEAVVGIDEAQARQLVEARELAAEGGM
jgi:hypothetical protein